MGKGKTTVELEFTSSNKTHTKIPEGTEVFKHKHHKKWYIEPNFFPKGSIERHDAIYHGFEVPEDFVRRLHVKSE